MSLNEAKQDAKGDPERKLPEEIEKKLKWLDEQEDLAKFSHEELLSFLKRSKDVRDAMGPRIE